MIGRRRPEPSAVQRAAGLLASADLLVRQAQELLEEEEPEREPARRRLRAVRPVPQGDGAAESVAESVAEDDAPRPRPAWLPWAGVAASTVVVAWGLTLLAPSMPLVLPGQWWVLAGVAVLVLALMAILPRRLGGLAPLAAWAAVSASPWGTAQPWSPWSIAVPAAIGVALTVIPTTPTDNYDDKEDTRP